MVQSYVMSSSSPFEHLGDRPPQIQKLTSPIVPARSHKARIRHRHHLILLSRASAAHLTSPRSSLSMSIRRSATRPVITLFQTPSYLGKPLRSDKALRRMIGWRQRWATAKSDPDSDTPREQCGNELLSKFSRINDTSDTTCSKRVVKLSQPT